LLACIAALKARPQGADADGHWQWCRVRIHWQVPMFLESIALQTPTERRTSIPKSSWLLDWITRQIHEANQ
jgi:hypothetical protein